MELFRQGSVKTVIPADGKDGVVITFDDGEENIYHYAFPILKEYGIRAMVFLVAGYIGKMNLWDISLTGKRLGHLNWRQILEMKKSGMEFGSHGMTHRNLTRLPIGELEFELSESKKTLEKELGSINAISYPFNRTDKLVIQKTKEAGYKYGFGGNGKDELLIKKEAIYITDNTASLRIKISEKPVIAYRYYRFQQMVINYFTIATMVSHPHPSPVK